MQTVTFKHYSLVPNNDKVLVYNGPDAFQPIYVADDMNSAKAFVTAYRNGVTWAVLASFA